MKNKINFTVFLGILLLGTAINAYAAGTSSSSWDKQEQEKKPVVSLYDRGVEASKNSDYQEALRLFDQASRQDRSNPDIFNMLAHTQLKLGMVDAALENYKKALLIRPKFPEAREYLGEAYIQAAKREIETLKSYGSEGNENLDDLVKAFKNAAADL